MRKIIFLAACLGFAYLAPFAGTVHAQSIQSVQIQVEVWESLQRRFGGARWQRIAKLTSGLVASELRATGVDGLNLWTFGPNASDYRLVFSLVEGRPNKMFIKVVNPDPKEFTVNPGGEPWCTPAAPGLVPRCDLGRLLSMGRGTQNEEDRKNTETRIAMSLVEGFKLDKWTNKLAEILQENVPITEDVFWYDKKIHATISRAYRDEVTAETPFKWSMRDFFQNNSGAPVLFCAGGQLRMLLSGDWVREPIRRKGETSDGKLGVYFLKSLPYYVGAEPLDITSRVCGEGYTRRRLSLRNPWRTAGTGQ